MNREAKRFDDVLRRLAGKRPVPNPGDKYPDFYTTMALILEDVERKIIKLEALKAKADKMAECYAHASSEFDGADEGQEARDYLEASKEFDK